MDILTVIIACMCCICMLICLFVGYKIYNGLSPTNLITGGLTGGLFSGLNGLGQGPTMLLGLLK